VRKARFGFAIDQITTQLALGRTLRGLTSKFGSFGNAPRGAVFQFTLSILATGIQ
jgi:hypothetical protein